MLHPIRIFVEGVADVKFLSDYISYIFPEFEHVKKESIIDCSGWTNNREKSENLMKQNTDNEGSNLVIFDADDDFDKRREKLMKWKEEANLSFELFLFPDNKSNGSLEDLLEKCILERNQPIFDCWTGYEKCLQSKHIEGREKPLTIPAKKTKIYGYLEALLENTNTEKEKIKERKRDYTNPDHWNLDSEALNPLKEFLDMLF